MPSAQELAPCLEFMIPGLACHNLSVQAHLAQAAEAAKEQAERAKAIDEDFAGNNTGKV